MGYLDDILSYATGNGDYDPYRSDDDTSNNSILSEEKRKRILLGIHAPEIYPNINDRGSSTSGIDHPLSGDFGAPGSWSDPKNLGRLYPEIFRNGESDTSGGARGTFDPARSLSPRGSIYEPGPNEAAYGEALRKPRPEYQEPKTKWWQNLVEGGLSSVLGPRTAQSVYQTPRQRAQEAYERQLGNYEGDIAQKRGAASLEIGERGRERQATLDQAKAEREANLYGRQMETQQKQGAYYERKANEPEKKTPFQEYLDNPEVYGKFLGLQHPDRGRAANALEYLESDDPEKVRAAREYLRYLHPEKTGGAGSVADTAKLRAIKVAATKAKDNALLKLKPDDFVTPEEFRQAKQDIQNAYENQMEAGGHNVEHYEYPVEKESAAQPKPPEQPGIMSRIGSMFGGGGGGAAPKRQITPEEAAAELRRRRGQ